jgi:hypothetical protein
MITASFGYYPAPRHGAGKHGQVPIEVAAP